MFWLLDLGLNHLPFVYTNHNVDDFVDIPVLYQVCDERQVFFRTDFQWSASAGNPTYAKNIRFSRSELCTYDVQCNNRYFDEQIGYMTHRI